MRALVIVGLVGLAAVSVGTVPAAAACSPGTSLRGAPAAGSSPGTPATTPSVSAHRDAAPRIAGITASLPAAVSCGSVKACLAVGSSYTMIGGPSGITVTTTTALAWNGSRWRIITVPVPKGGHGAELQQASCPSAAACVAVGDYVTNTKTGDARFYAVTWNGSALKQTATPPLPKGDHFAYLQAVSCVTARECVALGYATNAAGDNVNVAEQWNGATWTMRVQSPTMSGQGLELDSISCLSLTYCEVAGQLAPPNPGSSGSSGIFLGVWNAKSIAEQKAKLPKGAPAAVVTAVSCAARNHCTVTANSQITLSQADSFTETWNGKAWTATPIAPPKGEPFSFLWDVACPTAGLCVTVGSAGASLFGAGAPQAVAYNGKTWSRQTVPTPAKGREGEFASVSCPSAKLCVALGTFGPTGGGALAPLAGFWNGKSWRLAAA
jgi:hypothetical protein